MEINSASSDLHVNWGADRSLYFLEELQGQLVEKAVEGNKNKFFRQFYRKTTYLLNYV